MSSNIFNNNATSIVYSFTNNGFLQFWSLFVVQVLLAVQTSHIFSSSCLVYLKSTANRGSIIHPKKNSFTTFFWNTCVWCIYVCMCVLVHSVYNLFSFPTMCVWCICMCTCVLVHGVYFWCTAFWFFIIIIFRVTLFRLPESPHFLELNHPFQFKTLKCTGNDVWENWM